MSLLLYVAVLLVSVGAVVFGMDWVSAPAPQYRPAPAVAVRSDDPPAIRHLGSDAAMRPENASDRPKSQGRVEPALPVATANPPAANPAGAAPADANAPPTEIATEPPPRCDVHACETAYVSFRASDCTYQPSSGPRRLCEKGSPPRPAALESNAEASATPPSCNVEACQRAYFTFNPADCTYQPSNGPRRVCTKH